MLRRIAAVSVCALLIAAPRPAAAQLTGNVRIDGSSTVAPITTAVAELFGAEHRGVRATVGISGTGGGFKKFLDPSPDLRTDINDASRAIKQKEIDLAAERGISFIEIPIAIDGIAVMVHKDNDFCDDLTVEELAKIWAPGSPITRWSQVRSGFPDIPLKLFGPGTDSGTFDYFTKAIVGKEKSSRSDYTASESDNVLVQGIAGSRGALGYFGFSYYEANKDKLKLLGISHKGGAPVTPSLDIIRGGTYKPLSRPLFLYINSQSVDKPQVKAFLDFMFDNAQMIVEHPRVNYVALSPELYDLARNRINSRISGSAMAKAKSTTDLATIFKSH